MKLAVFGGAGAMGSLFGARLAQAGQDVTLVDVWQEGVTAIKANGLRVDDKEGRTQTIRLPATINPTEVGTVDLILVFVKSYHTKDAVKSALPLIGDETVVLTLQNGWGNAPRIAEMVGEERLLVGVTYHSVKVVGPGHIQHTGRGPTLMGELDGSMSDRLSRIATAFNAAGIEVTPTANVIKEIWSKLSVNVCTLPTSALLRFYTAQLIEHEGTMDLMRALMRETVAVANGQGIALDYLERWQTMVELQKQGAQAKTSMLQDLEKRRRTEIDVVNGAIVEAGRRLNIPTPYNETMVWLIRSLVETF